VRDADGTNCSGAEQATDYASRVVIDNDSSFDAPDAVDEVNRLRADLFPGFHGMPGGAFDGGVDIRFALFIELVNLERALVLGGPGIQKESSFFHEPLDRT
jgi:hypothetical protein